MISKSVEFKVKQKVKCPVPQLGLPVVRNKGVNVKLPVKKNFGVVQTKLSYSDAETGAANAAYTLEGPRL